MLLSNQEQEIATLCNRVRDSALSLNVLRSVKEAFYKQKCYTVKVKRI